ncbi:polysaccharide export protein [Bradyrhizobium arachidis]|nr:polysaccharide export protein [Bradyrhizobium sp. CCBAU 53338]UVO35420.1 polysaccharide export protein [Bradyrhizobium arachidis]
MLQSFLRVSPALLVSTLCLAGCGGITPQDAPNSAAIVTNAALTTAPSPPLPYAVLAVDPAILKWANSVSDRGGGSFSKLPGGNYKDITIGVGDIVAVTIFEAQSGGLFIPREASVRPGNFVDVPRQQVDQSGNITIPYAGSIKVAGLTARAVGDIIRERIKNRAIDPQAVVSVVEQRGNQISVLGEANAPLRFPVDPGGIRVLGAIARAGGPKNPAWETKVRIKRGGRTFVESMSSIVRHPEEDAFLAPGDVVYLSREPRIFMVFGSTPSPGSIGGTNNRRFTFENDTMTLAEAIAKAGGLDGTRANSPSVYVLRLEPKNLLKSAGIDVERFKGELVPTVYNFDWSKPDGMFFADSFQIRDHDAIVVSESPSTELLKFFSLMIAGTDTAVNIQTLTR